MRHRLKFNHLGRKTAHRKALLSHLACDLIENKRIVTTLAKAKSLRVYVEPLITKSKTNTTHQRRVVFTYLQDKKVVAELFSDVSAKIGERPGGYTRIIKLGARLGDAAEMALIELVDYNEIYSNDPDDKDKKKRTRRGGSARSKKASATENVEAKEPAVASEEKTTAKESKPKEEATGSGDTPPPVDEKEEAPAANTEGTPEAKKEEATVANKEDTPEAKKEEPTAADKEDTPEAKKEEPSADTKEAPEAKKEDSKDDKTTEE